MTSQNKMVRQEYAELAGDYDERWRSYVERTVAAAMERFQAPKGAQVLDLGCGTGVLLKRILSQRPDLKLFGADLTATMLEAAHLGPEVDLVEASARHLPYANESFDLVISLSSFHFWPEPVECLREIRRVLRPEGRFQITDWCHDDLACKLCGLYLRLLGDPNHRIYSRKECEDMLSQAGFSALEIERYRVGWIWGMMTASGVQGDLPKVGSD
jgi:SAM-dependent methyltransferase